MKLAIPMRMRVVSGQLRAEAAEEGRELRQHPHRQHRYGHERHAQHDHRVRQRLVDAAAGVEIAFEIVRDLHEREVEAAGRLRGLDDAEVIRREEVRRCGRARRRTACPGRSPRLASAEHLLPMPVGSSTRAITCRPSVSGMPAATNAAIWREKFMISARLTRCFVTSMDSRLLRARLIFCTSRLRSSSSSRANVSLIASISSLTLVPSAATAV